MEKVHIEKLSMQLRSKNKAPEEEDQS